MGKVKKRRKKRTQSHNSIEINLIVTTVTSQEEISSREILKTDKQLHSLLHSIMAPTHAVQYAQFDPTFNWTGDSARTGRVAGRISRNHVRCIHAEINLNGCSLDIHFLVHTFFDTNDATKSPQLH